MESPEQPRQTWRVGIPLVGDRVRGGAIAEADSAIFTLERFYQDPNHRRIGAIDIEPYIELRADTFNHTADAVTLTRGAETAGLPVIFTCRHRSEAYGQGQGFQGSEEERAAVYRAGIIHGGAKIIDIELARLREEKILSEVLDTFDVTTIVSAHYHEPQTRVELSYAVENAVEYGIPKLVMPATYPAHATYMLDILRERAHVTDLIAIATEPLGIATRIFGPQHGSWITFAHAGTRSAPGQLSYQDLHAIWEKIIPR